MGSASATLIKGFATFFATRVTSSGVYGRFVRYVDNSPGAGTSTSIIPDLADMGFYNTRMEE